MFINPTKNCKEPERIDPLISSKKLLEKCPQLWQTNLFGQP